LKVPFVDLRSQWKELYEKVERELRQIFLEAQFVMGPRVKALEDLLAQYLGVKHTIGVASGSDALLLALMALQIGPGDEVITTPFTFFSTVSAIVRVGARPVFADIDLDTFNIDPKRVEEVLTERTKAIIPVHLFGLCAEMHEILDIAKRHGLKVIEDAAQALGAEYIDPNGTPKKAGTMGDIGCFSFYPTKNLGGAGDGGLLATDHEDLGELLRLLRVHGMRGNYVHEAFGINSRLDEIQAAVLLVKFGCLEKWNLKRREKASYYERLLDEANAEALGVRYPRVRDGHIFHQYVIRTPFRDEVRKHLESQGIGTQVYYPVPMHLQPCLYFLGYKKGDFPNAEKASQEALALPIYPELSPEAQEYVVEKLVGFLKEKASCLHP